MYLILTKRDQKEKNNNYNNNKNANKIPTQAINILFAPCIQSVHACGRIKTFGTPWFPRFIPLPCSHLPLSPQTTGISVVHVSYMSQLQYLRICLLLTL